MQLLVSIIAGAEINKSQRRNVQRWILAQKKERKSWWKIKEVFTNLINFETMTLPIEGTHTTDDLCKKMPENMMVLQSIVQSSYWCEMKTKCSMLQIRAVQNHVAIKISFYISKIIVAHPYVSTQMRN